MPRGSHSIRIQAPAQAVFDLIHDYDRRLDWDSMLSEARLLSATAGLGARSRCVGSWKCFWLPIESTYVSYEHGKVAAVKMDNRPLFFDEFAATIRHDDLAAGESTATYIYHFRAKPRWLGWLFEPIMNAFLNREVKHRLNSLKSYLESAEIKSS